MENNQTMKALISPTVRELVKSINNIGLKKEDIVSIIQDLGLFVLLYYK